jgi:hypothetical protein
MNFKINWGVGIAVVIVLFIIGIAANVIFSLSRKSELVSSDYYKKEISYQKQIDKMALTKKLPEKMKIFTAGDNLVLKFPDIFKGQKVDGEIILYRPSNDMLDKKSKINLNDENLQLIDVKQFAKGLWRVKINWKVNGSEYYNEETINF